MKAIIIASWMHVSDEHRGLGLHKFSTASVPVSLADTCSAAFSTDLKASSAPGKQHLSGCTILTSRLTAALMLLASAPGCRSRTCRYVQPSHV